MAASVELACEMVMELGEGPVWLADKGQLAFVDIKGRAIHRFDPVSGKLFSVATESCPTFVVPTVDGSFLVGSESEVRRLEGDRLGAVIASISQPMHNRTNDATVDTSGRLWFGTMDDHEALPTGTIWCLDRGALRSTGISAIITNGPALDAAGAVLYHVDSVARRIWRCSVYADGTLGASELFVQLAPEDGYPDGVVVDAAGHVWVGLWDGWAVRRYDPSGGLVEEVTFPCGRITKIAFGGADMQTAYATTARIGLSAEDLAKQPLAGSLFSFRVTTPGNVLPQVVI